MKKKNIKIIDKTLVTLSELYSDKIANNLNEITELSAILNNIGTDCLEVSQEILYLALPSVKNKNKHLIIKNNLDIKEYNDFKLIVHDYIIFSNGKEPERKIHVEIEIADATKIDSLKDIAVLRENVSGFTIKGLDNILLQDYKEVYSKLIEFFGEELNLCPGNSYGCASAIAIEWLEFGGRCVSTTYGGIGGGCPLEEVLAARRFIFNDKFQGNLTLLPKATKIIESITKEKPSNNKPIIGSSIFDFESGIHADGIFKNPKTYEPYNPKRIGGERRLIIGKHSGLTALKKKLGQLRIELSEDTLPNILENIRLDSSRKERSLSDNEILDICKLAGGNIPWMRY
jgi:Isopropylmalate/homocitrate/citramalate synthases